jgi:hypothetical protein
VETELRFDAVEIHTSPWEAHVSRALLESEGIPAYLANEHLVWANWPMSHMLGGVRLLVRHEHVQLARQTLALRDTGVLQSALLEEYPPNSRACSQCGSGEFAERRNWASILTAFMLLFICRAIFPPVKDHVCKSCGAVE